MATTTQSHIPSEPLGVSSSKRGERRGFRLLGAILMVTLAYATASAAENEQRRQRTIEAWEEYMLQGISAVEDGGTRSEADVGSPAIFVRHKAPNLFILNGSWIADGSLVSLAIARATRFELYEMKLTKCYPSMFECAPGVTKYNFFLLERLSGSRPEILRTWSNLKMDMTGYDPAHGRYVPDVEASMKYEQIRRELRVSIDHIQQPFSAAIQLDL